MADYIQKHVVELPANGRHSSQIVFAELPSQLMYELCELSIFFTSEDDAEIDVHFAYRRTAFPRGHYTHGS